MLIEFDLMPEDARLWIYQANRPLSNQEFSFVKKYTEQFLSQWQAHGQDLIASYKIKYNQFLVISVDETSSKASGCSIDSSVHLIKDLEKELEISFITTNKVAFLIEDKIHLFSFNNLKEQISNSIITQETKVFDNTVKNIEEFKTKWLVPSTQTWVRRYFK
ncbi:MAG: hypothetical protein AAGC64_12180 [Bacteroidota bacterium]